MAVAIVPAGVTALGPGDIRPADHGADHAADNRARRSGNKEARARSDRGAFQRSSLGYEWHCEDSERENSGFECRTHD
jgi:hypothetical protein